MIEVDQGRDGILRLQHAVFDVNGTITRDGQLVEGVIERMHALRRVVKVHLLTANTYGTQELIDRLLAVSALPNMESKVLKTEEAPEDEQKASYVKNLGPESVAAVGNGRNDRLMLKNAALGIAIIGPEGAAVDAALAAKVLAPDPLSALDLLLHPARLKATLRV
jgi:soluble P-type ATPase